MTNLGPLVGDPSVAYGINNHGHIVGSAFVNNRFHAFRLHDGVLTLFDETSAAQEINDNGLIAGFGFVIQNDLIKPMHFPDGSFSDPHGINNLGQVVGQADNSNGISRAFLYEDETMTDIGTLGGRFAVAFGVNNLSQIVGHSFDGISDQARAFMYSNGIMTDLNALIPPDSDWFLSQAHDINDRGQIVGRGLYNGEIRAFRLDPIPEPTANLLFVLGGLTFCLAGKCKRRILGASRAAVRPSARGYDQRVAARHDELGVSKPCLSRMETSKRQR